MIKEMEKHIYIDCIKENVLLEKMDRFISYFAEFFFTDYI